MPAAAGGGGGKTVAAWVPAAMGWWLVRLSATTAAGEAGGWLSSWPAAELPGERQKPARGWRPWRSASWLVAVLGGRLFGCGQAGRLGDS